MDSKLSFYAFGSGDATHILWMSVMCQVMTIKRAEERGFCRQVNLLLIAPNQPTWEKVYPGMRLTLLVGNSHLQSESGKLPNCTEPQCWLLGKKVSALETVWSTMAEGSMVDGVAVNLSEE